MSYTYNQIVKVFNDIADTNPFIKRFGSGEINDIEVFGPTVAEYPYLWIVPQQTTIGENTLNYVFRVMVFDIDELSDKLQQEILSDCLQTLIDVIKDFRYRLTDDVYIQGEPVAIPFTHRFVDYNTGWYSDLTIITEINNNPCE